MANPSSDKEQRPAPFSPKGSGGLLLDNRYQIISTERLPQFDHGPAIACRVKDLRNAEAKLLAYISHPTLRPRAHFVKEVQEASVNSGIMKLNSCGYVQWHDGTLRAAFIYDAPGGMRLSDYLTDKSKAFTEDQVKKNFLQPLIAALKFFDVNGVTHRHISPANIFFASPDNKQLVVGDCLALPAAAQQSCVFEPIESAMTDADARADGRMVDDLYSVGVTCLALLTGKIPLSDLKPEQIVMKKIKEGSFGALVGRLTLPKSVEELFKGLLTDFPEERWGVKDLERWISGTYSVPKQPRLSPKAPRPFTYEEQDYETIASLAYAMALAPAKAGATFGSVRFRHWFERSVKKEDLVVAFENLLDKNNISAGQEGTFSDESVARMLMHMYPQGPIHYKGRHIMPGGMSNAIYAALEDQDKKQTLAEIIAKQLITEWLAINPEVMASIAKMSPKLFSLHEKLQRNLFGFGLERCLYELDSAQVCLSPLLAGQEAKDVTETLMALEKAAARGGSFPLDRHLAAYFATYCSIITDNMLFDLARMEDPARRNMGALKLLSAVQATTGIASLPNLAAWLGNLMGPVIDEIHHVYRRKRMQRDLKNVLKSGRLRSLLNLVNNETEHRLDHQQFAAAQTFYRLLAEEYIKLDQGKALRHEQSKQLGGQVSASISGVVAILIATTYLIFHFMG